MIKPAGIIARLCVEPTIHTEYLTNDPGPDQAPTWSLNESDAFFFEQHWDAEILAKDIHRRIGGHLVYAITRKPRVAMPEREMFACPDGSLTEIAPSRRPYRRRRRHEITGSAPQLADLP